MTVVASGDVTPDELRAELERAFSGWRGPRDAPSPAPAAPAAPPASGPRVFLVDWPGASQTHVAVIAPSLARSSEDYAVAMVWNRILGGGAGARLGKNLREQRGLTYWASSRVVTHHGPGEVIAGAAVVRDKAGIAVRELLRELERLVVEPVTPDELRAAKDGLVRELPSHFETLSWTLWSFGEAPVHGLPDDELASRARRIEAVTPADVQRIARRLTPRDALRVVVTGDGAVVRKDLEALGLGPVVAFDPSGSPSRR